MGGVIIGLSKNHRLIIHEKTNITKAVTITNLCDD